VVAADGTGLELIQALALGHPFNDVGHDDVAEAFFGQEQGRGGADVPGADDCNLIPHDFTTFVNFFSYSTEPPAVAGSRASAPTTDKGHKLGHRNRIVKPIRIADWHW
jgi:hypothetical protein